ncbi:hypothetical protein ACI6Q2_19170 [Chitinophagaceae bacterium LWZ2-11]
MKEEIPHSYYNKFSILCAIGYIIPIIFFFLNEKFTEFWLLYISNTIFASILIICGIWVNGKFKDHSRLGDLIVPGIRVVIRSIILICILLAIVSWSFGGSVARQIDHKPADLYIILAMNAIVVNFLIGCFSVFLGGVAILKYKQNAKGEDIT